MFASSAAPFLDALRDITGCLAERVSLLKTLEKSLGLLRAHIVIQDPESRNLRLSLCCGQPYSHVAYLPGRGVTGQVFSQKQSIIVPIMKEHPYFRNRLFSRTEEELASLGFVCVPERGRPGRMRWRRQSQTGRTAGVS